jgi:proline dehydrogenase
MRHLSALAHRGRSLSTVAFRSTTSKALDCSDPKLAFSSYSTFELLRGATVLTACSQPWLVKHSEPLLALSDRVLGRKATEALLRHSVFAHFVAGETAETIAPTLRGLREQGVGGILDYAAEADLESEGGTDVTVNQPARSYPYVSEAQCDANHRIFLSAVDAVHATTPEGFAAVKVTALGDPALLERVSTAVRELRAFFETLDPAKQGVISRDAFRRGWREAFEMSDEEIEAVFERIDTDMDGDVDLVEFTNALPLHAIGPLVQRCRSKGPLYRSALDVDECAGLERMLARLDGIALHAKALGVRLMIDAEHTYFQPAIDHTVLRLSRAHNREYPVVFGTYQAYLRECDAKLRLDLDRAHREGWHLGAKLVRGAYMVHERQRAKEHGYPDPIHPTVRVHQYYPDCPPHYPDPIHPTVRVHQYYPDCPPHYPDPIHPTVRVPPSYPDCPPHQVPDCHPHHPDHGH